MYRTFAASILLALGAAPAIAQDNGTLVTTLGSDTLAIEQFTRADGMVHSTRIVRTPNVSVAEYTATLGPAGQITSFQYVLRPGGTIEQQPNERGTLTFGADSVTVAIQRGEAARNFKAAAPMPTFPMIPFTYSLYDQMVRHSRAAGRDSINYGLLYPGAMNSLPTWVSRHGADSVSIGFFDLPLWGVMDASGGLRSLSGEMTTQKVDVRNIATVDMAAVERSWATAQAEGRTLGQLSPRDTARGKVGESEFTVDYGRPSVRGRTVFGGIVPWGEVWRTGANAATQFTTQSPVTFGSVKLQPGTYTVWTVPTATGVTLIFNGQTGQWGTEYDKSQDVGRVPLQVARSETPVELFTIMVEDRGEKRGALIFAWNHARWEAPFTVE